MWNYNNAEGQQVAYGNQGAVGLNRGGGTQFGTMQTTQRYGKAGGNTLPQQQYGSWTSQNLGNPWGNQNWLNNSMTTTTGGTTGTQQNQSNYGMGNIKGLVSQLTGTGPVADRAYGIDNYGIRPFNEVGGGGNQQTTYQNPVGGGTGTGVTNTGGGTTTGGNSYTVNPSASVSPVYSDRQTRAAMNSAINAGVVDPAWARRQMAGHGFRGNSGAYTQGVLPAIGQAYAGGVQQAYDTGLSDLAANRNNMLQNQLNLGNQAIGSAGFTNTIQDILRRYQTGQQGMQGNFLSNLLRQFA